MAVNVYYSSDASAPSLSGTAGALVSVLDACLVNGYGSKGGAGWTIAYTATNKRAYLQGAGSSGMVLYIDDTGVATVNEALATGFESMSSITAGLGQFPLTSQVNLGGVFGGAVMWRKTVNATVRNWTVVADSTCFYVFMESGDVTSPVSAQTGYFGDIFPFKASDSYKPLLIGFNGNSNTASYFPVCCSNTNLTVNGHYMPRTWTGAGTSINVGKLAFAPAFGNNSSLGNPGTGIFSYPNGPDGGLYLAPVHVVHSSAMRGYMKGLWSPQQNQPANHNDVFTGTGNMSGKTFLVQNVVNSGGGSGSQVFIEISNTWG